MSDARRTRITTEDVAHVARLARLELSSDELEGQRVQLARILDYMAELDAVDVSDVPPTFHTTVTEAPLRDDRVAPSLDRDAALANAPRVEEEGFAVPRVLGEGS